MAEELDVEAMLEAPYRKKRSRERKRSRSRDRKRSRSRERKRSRSREKRRSRERRSSRERGGRYREHHQQQRRQSKSKSPVRKEKSPIRTVFCMQLAARIRPRDLEDFFSAVGKAEKNRAAAAAAAASSLQRAAAGPTRLNGFITFLGAECAQKAVDQLDGFELAGRPMKVSHVTERSDNDDMQLMARLAEAAMNPLNMNPLLPAQPLATHCFQLSHMFNSCSGEIPGWETDIQHDVIEECRKHGGVVHIYIDKKSAEGNVYVKCPTVQSAMAAVNSLHGRYFAGQLITASFVPLSAYHQLFPESAYATHLLAPPPRR
ncbi:hypothetical protein F7725_016277 [Dissostichus mawsoni]|uniref:RRM domain-containing protein n=1 Tax=Dissostichus mawsoni TaxID=36200 RepID=A0A7J5Z173_DISMA|nr:hypothetical protein F7725_016277 [Dissostichus mawsoni]